jgi:CheY-like chemotaxis protein
MHVLLVDDNLLSCTRLLHQVREAGWSSAECGAGQALAGARHRRPDVIIVNLVARSHDPVDLIHALKTEPDLAGIPVLGFCGHTDTSRRRAAIDAGCDRVVTNSSVTQHLPTLLSDLA